MHRFFPFRTLGRRVLLAGLGVALACPVAAADWPHFRGPQHNGISAETQWDSRWGVGGPRKLWTAQVGEGYSGVAVAGGRAYTIGNRGNQDTLYCLNAETGQVIWRYSYGCGSGGDYGGPRATPAVEDGLVFGMSRDALAYAVNAGSGKAVWTRDLRRETGSESPRWGFAGSALVQGNR
ncbi:MAG: alcohol dehydrogenase, partial [Armatimonadetes bacterium]|nr:alcohol dehydrogenase [Armatimonadota bacterium]